MAQDFYNCILDENPSLIPFVKNNMDLNNRALNSIIARCSIKKPIISIINTNDNSNNDSPHWVAFIIFP